MIFIHTTCATSEEAEKEIRIWFRDDELLDYDLITENVFYSKDWGKVKK